MANVSFLGDIFTLRGKLRKSDDYYFVTKNGKTYTCKQGHRKTALKPSEIAAQQRFKSASDFKMQIMHDPTLQRHFQNLWAPHKNQYPTFGGWLIHYYYELNS